MGKWLQRKGEAMDTARTDLALEAKEKFERDHVEIGGVVLEEEYLEKEAIRISRVVIETEKGAKAMGKPKGTYITLEAEQMSEEEEGYHREISRVLADCIKKLLPAPAEQNLSVLVVGLGNRDVTPDALGPCVVNHLRMNRHLVKEYGRMVLEKEDSAVLSGLVPGVMGQTGMETVEIIRGVVEEAKPNLVIAVDALAARNAKRLNRTIQIANTGIHPGSGVGNQRHAIDEKSLGVPVLAIGVPTVVDAATIVGDAIENLFTALESHTRCAGLSEAFSGLDASDRRALVLEVLSPNLNGMFVTPKDIDETIRRISYTISEALHMAMAT
jgi:spore protease